MSQGVVDRLVLTALFVLTSASTAAAQPVASATRSTLLQPGVELVYEAAGREGTPWRVEAVEANLAIAGRVGCVRVRFAAGGPRPGADVRITCESDGVLHSLDTLTGRWRADRPMRPQMSLDVAGTGGRTSRFITAGETVEEVSGHRLRVIETTVVTLDSAGTVLRRLRERFAPAIGTATWGAFEVPDGAGGWRLQREFRLAAIRTRP
jgi:hypothetical protein